MANVKPIRTEKEYEAALARLTNSWMRNSVALKVTSLMSWLISSSCTRASTSRWGIQVPLRQLSFA